MFNEYPEGQKFWNSIIPLFNQHLTKNLLGGKMMKFIKLMIIALLSTIIFSIVMGGMNYITMVSKSPEGFIVPMIFFGMYAAPAYVLGGIPSYFFIEKICSKMKVTSYISVYFTKLFLYGLAGIVISFIFTLLLTAIEGGFFLLPNEFVAYLFCGFIAALTFYHVALVLNQEGPFAPKDKKEKE
ncbi:hypothetical protein SAMN05216389_11576 [Oceanobacillus limi]|uniref:Uncharacterized protein n=2 Tax=Oceanobacillus limi TaxID=930131 RepID=A0A1I0FKH8_9BACI|nr:hypothetical protein SAMN05216389_11576 [Oceanobacillus limi]